MTDIPQLKISSSFDTDQLADQFTITKRIHIPNFLDLSSAELIYQNLIQQEQWNLAWNNSGHHTDMDYQSVLQWTDEQQRELTKIIHSQAEHAFQYCFAAIPIYDIYHSQLLPGHFFNKLYEFFNSPSMIGLARAITKEPTIEFADMQATRFSRGHFLNQHDDNVKGKNRLAAYVLNLSPNWRTDWGGALMFAENGANSDAYFPKFNALNIFSVPQKHSVTVISPFAPASRYSLTGWFRY